MPCATYPNSSALLEGHKDRSVYMRYLALDLGDRRIGLAAGGDQGVPVVPAGYLTRERLREDVSRVVAAAKEREAGAIIVGMPYSLSGEVGPQAKLAQGFIRELRRSTELPVHTVDERFTSVEAERMLRETGIQPSRRKGDVDAAAAVLILERFLAQL